MALPGKGKHILQVDCGWGGDKSRRDQVGREKCTRDSWNRGALEGGGLKPGQWKRKRPGIYVTLVRTPST